MEYVNLAFQRPALATPLKEIVLKVLMAFASGMELLVLCGVNVIKQLLQETVKKLDLPVLGIIQHVSLASALISHLKPVAILHRQVLIKIFTVCAFGPPQIVHAYLEKIAS